MPGMDDFFAQPGVRHRVTREWNDNGQRHWFKVGSDMTLDQIRELLSLVPMGAYVTCFDQEYDSPSDPGAWVAFQRYPELWTAKFNNHGWSSDPVPIAFEDAALIFWECRDFDYCKFLRVLDNSELMAHSGLKTDLPQGLDTSPDSKPARHIRNRVAEIKGRNAG